MATRAGAAACGFVRVEKAGLSGDGRWSSADERGRRAHLASGRTAASLSQARLPLQPTRLRAHEKRCAAPERRRRPRLEPAACVRRVWAPGPLCGDAPFRRPPARLRRFGGRAHLPQRRSRANVDKAPVWLQRRVLRVRRRRLRRPEPRLRDLRQPGRDRHADEEALHDFGRRKSLAAAQSHRQAPDRAALERLCGCARVPVRQHRLLERRPRRRLPHERRRPRLADGPLH